jgi:two-component system sensor kinase FixL
VLLQQCVLNLLVNAFDALMDTPELERKVTVGIAPEKPGWIALSVGDNGTGIDPSVAGRVFEPFVTTKSGGMGLGLLVTQSIVEDHGGKIWLVPNAERGTTFTFTLPLMEKTIARRKVARKNTGERKPRDK